MDINKDSGNYCVYKHTNKINGKIYIGITQQKPEERWKNGKGYTHNKHFKSAIQKYGWDNFTHEVLIDNMSKYMAEKYEILLIKQFNSTNREFGYNKSKGGELGNIGLSPSEEVRQKIRESLTGRKMIYSEEVYAKKVETKMGANNPRAKAVICEGVRYETIEDFKRNNNISSTIPVGQWLNGEKSMPEEWYDKGLRYVDETLGSPIKRNYKIMHHDAKMVICEGNVFESIKLCADHYGVNPSTMSCWLRGRRTMPKLWVEKGLSYYIQRDDENDK